MFREWLLFGIGIPAIVITIVLLVRALKPTPHCAKCNEQLERSGACPNCDFGSTNRFSD